MLFKRPSSTSFYVRIQVPKNRADLRQKEFILSLKTGLKREAMRKASQAHHTAIRCFSDPDAYLSIDSIKNQILRELGRDSEVKSIFPISEALSLYLSEKQLEGIAHKTVKDIESTIGLLIDFHGDLGMDSFNRAKAVAFRDSLIEGRAIKTVNKKISFVSAFFNHWHHLERVRKNPFHGLTLTDKRNKRTLRDRFNDDDLKAIFSKLPDDEEKKWITYLGLYTGMRLNEICQLRKADIKQKGAHYYIDVALTEESQKLKTMTSERVIPVHPILIDKGFLSYKASVRDPRLFPDQTFCQQHGYIRKYSRWFGKHLTEIGVKTSTKNFHSFRHTFIDELKQKGIEETVIAELVGHTYRSETFGRYAKGFNVEKLLEDLTILDFGV